MSHCPGLAAGLEGARPADCRLCHGEPALILGTSRNLGHPGRLPGSRPVSAGLWCTVVGGERLLWVPSRDLRRGARQRARRADYKTFIDRERKPHRRAMPCRSAHPAVVPGSAFEASGRPRPLTGESVLPPLGGLVDRLCGWLDSRAGQRPPAVIGVSTRRRPRREGASSRRQATG